MRERRICQALAVPLAVVAGIAVAGCSTQPSAKGGAAPADHTVVVAAVPATGASALYIAQDEGLFARAGLDVRIESSASAADGCSRWRTRASGAPASSTASRAAR